MSLANEVATSLLIGKRVVVCEDDAVTLLFYRKTLRKAGLHLVAEVTTGKEVVEVALGERPDIVIMDVELRDMNGLQAAEHILEACSICIIVVSGMASQQSLERAWQAGVCAFISKPVNSVEFLSLLDKAYTAFSQGQAIVTGEAS